MRTYREPCARFRRQSSATRPQTVTLARIAYKGVLTLKYYASAQPSALRARRNTMVLRVKRRSLTVDMHQRSVFIGPADCDHCKCNHKIVNICATAYVYTSICAYTCMYKYIYIYIHTIVYIYIYNVYASVYILICVYIYIYKFY